MEPELSPEKKKALEEAQKLRDKAGEEAKLRGTCFDQSKKEFESGDKAKAKQLSEEGKKHGALMEQYNKQAADAFFAAHNQGRDDYTIDLHGLYVEEALERLNQRFDKIGRKGTLVIIWGAGNHSEGGVRKIKPAVVEVLNKGGWKYEDDTPNHGCCTVYFTAPSAETSVIPPRPTVAPPKPTPATTKTTAPSKLIETAPSKELPIAKETKRACSCCCVM